MCVKYLEVYAGLLSRCSPLLCSRGRATILLRLAFPEVEKQRKLGGPRIGLWQWAQRSCNSCGRGVRASRGVSVSRVMCGVTAPRVPTGAGAQHAQLTQPPCGLGRPLALKTDLTVTDWEHGEWVLGAVPETWTIGYRCPLGPSVTGVQPNI